MYERGSQASVDYVTMRKLVKNCVGVCSIEVWVLTMKSPGRCGEAADFLGSANEGLGANPHVFVELEPTGRFKWLPQDLCKAQGFAVPCDGT